MSIAAEATRPEFQYIPLQGSRTIRLVQFLSGPALQCRMRTYELADAPAYVALSYTWGSPIFEKSLEVDGSTLRVTKNLHEAVHQLHSYARDRALLFWADSICVNQQDLRERSEQVQLMNMIYSRAKSVLIWLGPLTSSIEFAINRMIEWEQHFEHMPRYSGKEWIENDSEISVSDPRFSGEPGSNNDRAFEGLRELCSRQWWTRAWVVQESMANLQCTNLCCGNRMIAWETIQLALSLVRYTQYHRQKGTAGNFFHGNHCSLAWIRIWKQGDHMIRLLDVLDILRSFDCEDPRDRVYASLGLATDSLQSRLTPDYTRSCSDIYQDVVATLLSSSEEHALDFLGYINMPSDGSLSLPSWVPDWTINTGHCPFPKYLEPWGFKTDRVYNASGSIAAQAYIFNNRLHLQGATVDTITLLTDVATSAHSYDFTVEERWRPTSPKQDYISGGTLLEAYQHTLRADVKSQASGDRCIILRGGSVDWVELSINEQRLNLEEGERLHWVRADIKNATSRRRLIETSQGYIGLGPEYCQVGDQVCVLYGGQVLYILRECGSHEFKFVGECYLHGMMDGEALQHKHFSEREFVLV